jgi:hypothetical protein
MNVQPVFYSAVSRWDDIRLSIRYKPYMTHQGFIQNLLNYDALVVCPLGSRLIVLRLVGVRLSSPISYSCFLMTFICRVYT